MRDLSFKGLLLSAFLLTLLAANAYAQNFVYVDKNNAGSNSVAAFSVAANGTLTPVVGSPFATGGLGDGDYQFYAANRARTCIVGNRLYVSDDGSNSVSGFDINPATGALTLVPGSPFATGGQAGNGISLDCTPNGQFLIAANAGSHNIAVFSIAANGSLTPVAGSPFFAGGEPDGIRITPNGKFLAAAEPYSDVVAMFSIAANGSLTPVTGSPFASPAYGGVAGVEINCAGDRLFAAQASTSGTNLDVFRIGADGALTLLQTSSNPLVGSNSNVAVLSPNQQFLFVSNQDTDTITVFNVAANGTLSLTAGSPFANPGGAMPQQLATNQAGTLLYANNENGTVSVFNVASNGSLSPVAGSPFAASSGLRPGIAAFPPASCGASSSFDICLQDDSNGNLLRFNSATGEYLFTRCGTGFMLGGTGTVTVRGSVITLQHNAADRRVLAQIDNATHTGKASVQVFSLGTTFTISDRNTANNTCACP